jgi:uncharacterized protein with PIN domain
MLGTLAKWLRILGYDTIYDSAMDDHQLARVARAEGRVLLTRDRALAGRRGVDSVLVESEELEAQIAQVVSDLDLDLDPSGSFSRCPVCNEGLTHLDREEARERVPVYVARTHDKFKCCPGCGRVYWRGSHREKMEERITQFLRKENGG